VPSVLGCEECLKIGSPWVHLRLCRTCGHVGCCDSSPNCHATKHFHKTGHPIKARLEAFYIRGRLSITHRVEPIAAVQHVRIRPHSCGGSGRGVLILPLASFWQIGASCERSRPYSLPRSERS
jgi:Zn-finger in ubiquitin-hydrolases and other protein